MSERPTPETDKAASRDYAPLSVPYDFSQALERQRDEVKELAWELRDGLQRLVDNGHSEGCALLNYAIANCDCGVASAQLRIAKADQILMKKDNSEIELTPS